MSSTTTTTTTTTTSLLPKSLSPFLKTPPPHNSLIKFSFFNNNNHNSLNHQHSKPNTLRPINIKRKDHWLDIFDDGDDPFLVEGTLFTDGKQEEDPRPPDNPDNPYGFLKFQKGFLIEIAPLALKIRGDVRRCCCIVAGGVYENLLFFPVIQLLKDRYPGVLIDIVTTDRGKQAYEINKNVRWTTVFDPDDHFPDPAEYTDMIGVIKNRYYDMVLSTKLAGFGHGAFLFMSSARDRVSYVYPNVNSAGSGPFLSEKFVAETTNLSDGGFNMYHQMAEWLGRPFLSVPRHPVPPLKVSISRKLKAYVEEKYKTAGVERGKYIVIHGIKSDSKASMQSRGDKDSLLPIPVWAEITSGLRELLPLFVIPHEREREDVEEIVGFDANIVMITTPGQMAALITDSAGVIATNTAAIQFANARDKPSIGLFSSEEKGKLFVPEAEEKNCVIVASKTGKLEDIDVEAVKKALSIFDMSLALV